jgi:predicted ATP-grasp superfamily ATP-dependent carboligase
LTHVLIGGVSTRAAAASAATAGYEVTAYDAYGDLDHHASVRIVSLPRDLGAPFTASAVARASRDVSCDAVVYLSSFENHPRAVQMLAADRVLWGNPPDVLRRVRNPVLLASSLQQLGFTVPLVSSSSPTSGRWLLKPRRSGGGHGVRDWNRRAALTSAYYLQESIEGIPGSVVFVAAGGRVVPLGISRQLVGDAAFGASGYRYCGNILQTHGGELESIVDAACTLAEAVAETFQLVGVNGIDFIARDGVPYPIEVNPRWSGSMELVEHAYGLSVFGIHAEACAGGTLPRFDLRAARQQARAWGKVIVFAREPASAPDTTAWLADRSVRDVPQPGESFAAGQPVCTVLAEDADAARCYDVLATRANGVYRQLVRDRRGS